MRNYPFIALLFFLWFFHLCKGQEKPIELKAQLEVDTKAKLGEGSIWNYKEHKLYWIDTEGGNLFIYEPVSKAVQIIDIGQRIGTVVPATGGNVVVALQDGIYGLDLKSGERNLLADPEDSIKNIRFNDGKCDPSGRFWVGSMGLDFRRCGGSLYKMNKYHEVEKMLSQVTVSNGIVWSLDKKRMYYTDSPTGKVMVFDYNDETGEISNPKIAINIPSGMGNADGMTIDAEGMLWIAHWEGAFVGRWDPVTGKLLMRINLPVKNVSSCAFGGKDLDVLYITTAGFYASQEEKKKWPLSGCLFSVKPGVKGVKAFFYEGKTKK